MMRWTSGWPLLVLVVLLSLAALSRAAGDPERAFQPVKTELMRGGDAAETLTVDVTGWRDLYLVVTFGDDNYRSDQAIWAEPRLTDAGGRTVDLTSITPNRAQVGWGRLLVNVNQKGQPLRIGDTRFKTGFWAHGPSLLHFKLDGRYAKFETRVGIDTGAGNSGSVHFEITNVAPQMPPPSAYKEQSGAPAVKLTARPAEESDHQFNTEAARTLLQRGIDKLVFVRRFTLSANHVYTEYVNSRWTPGGGLCVLDLNTGLARDLVPELSAGVVNRFDISYDAKKIIFDYKRTSEEGYRIYEVGVDGTGLRQLTFPVENEQKLVRDYGSAGYHHGTDDMHPCYLPDGDIVFVSTRCQYGILCNAGDVYTTKVLFRMNRDGGDIRPLSNSPVSEASPAMLPDGRILYHRWEYVDKAAGNLKCLWSMNPDGTASAEVYGNTITFPETMIYARPIPGADGKIVMLGTSHCCPNNAMGAVIVIDTSDDVRSPETMRFVTNDIRALAHTGFHFQDASGQWKHDKTGTLGRLFKDPYPLSENLFIAAHKPKGPAWNDPVAYDLCLLDGSGRKTLLYQDEEISCWHPYPLVARQKPPVTVAAPDPELAQRNLARCVVSDVYRGMEGVERGAVKYLRLLEEVPRPWAVRKSWYRDDRDGMAHSAIGDGFLGLKVQHGVVPVEEDGSAQFYVPAMRNIYLQALDENLLAIQTERTYVHYMPGETRSCVGCHETPNQTQRPTSGLPLAMLRPPSVPAPQPGEATAQKLFDYDRQIQPIWDKHCVECHNHERADGDLNLCGDPQGVYSLSYHNLVKLSKTEKQLLGHRKPRNENVGSAGIEYLPPYTLGAPTSPLAAMLSGGKVRLRNPELLAYAEKLAESHHDVQLSEAEFLQVANWLDVNCPFHPSYWGRLNAKYKADPFYRPQVTFEEALLRTIPESVAGAYERP
jgi:hypothetical protein